MLEKKCVLLLYGEGRYDTSMAAIKEYIELERTDAYVVAVSDKDLYSYNRYKIAFFMYKFGSRACNFVNRFRIKYHTFKCRIKLGSGKNKPIKKRKPPEGVIAKFFYTLTEKHRRIHNLLVRYVPDIVVCSTPKLLHDTITAKHKAAMQNISIAALITDYSLDARFVDYKANYYFVQNDNILERLVSHGVEKRRIKVSGTPLTKSSIVIHNRQEVLAEMGIENDYYNVILVGGRYGGEIIKNAFTSVIEMDHNMNIIVMAGGSDGLAKFVSMLSKNKNCEGSVYVVEEVNDLSKIYSIADIMITMPTASTTYEATYHNIKMITCRGADAIEENNSQYLATKQLSLQGRNNNELVQSMSKYMMDEEFCYQTYLKQNDYIISDCDKVIGDIILLIADKNHINRKLALQNEDDKKDSDSNIEKVEMPSDATKVLEHVETIEKVAEQSDEIQAD